MQLAQKQPPPTAGIRPRLSQYLLCSAKKVPRVKFIHARHTSGRNWLLFARREHQTAKGAWCPPERGSQGTAFPCSLPGKRPLTATSCPLRRGLATRRRGRWAVHNILVREHPPKEGLLLTATTGRKPVGKGGGQAVTALVIRVPHVSPHPVKRYLVFFQ